MGNGTGQRPLSEVSPVAQRRNSPSWDQTTKMMKNSESSPFEYSQRNSSPSPRRFWQGRDSASPTHKASENSNPYNPEIPFSPSKRASLENLMKLSRVKNNNISRENKEYDPANVNVSQRPLAVGRPCQQQGQGDDPQLSQTSQPPSTTPLTGQDLTPRREQHSPPKSSLSKASRYGMKGASFDPAREIWSDMDNEPRHAKSVTFDAAPPQVNEYEMTTPDPSSIASESREGSYEYDDEDEDISFDRDSFDRDDSFDASLEDIEKTPVVLPEDWRFITPESANDDVVQHEDDPFVSGGMKASPDSSPSASGGLDVQHARVESLDSNGERRPLPPLPSPDREQLGSRSSSPAKLSAAFELGSVGQRTLPFHPGPASCSKADISELGHSTMTLEERLRLMMLRDTEDRERTPKHCIYDDKDSAKSAEIKTEDQRPVKSSEEDHSVKNSENSLGDSFSFPRISRDSILRDLQKSQEYFDESFEDSFRGDLSTPPFASYDPDIPIPSLELDNGDMENSVVIKEEDDDDDIYVVPEYREYASDISLSLKESEANTDDGSQYSCESFEGETVKDECLGSFDDSQATPVPPDRIGDVSTAQLFTDDTRDSKLEVAGLNMAVIRESLKRPTTPENQIESPLNEHPSTPDSLEKALAERDAGNNHSEEECIPDPVATVKAPGGSLKTRPSLTPLDIDTMAANRRRVSEQQAPAIPDNQPSTECEPSVPAEHDHVPVLPGPELAKRQSSLVKLDIPFTMQEESLGFGLDKEFDRVIEAQKRGYLMRQNTRVIIASSHSEDDIEKSQGNSTDQQGSKSAASSPRKVSQQTWTTVPWNGQARRASIKIPHAIPKKKPAGGPVPPIPGHASSVQEVVPPPMKENETIVPDLPILDNVEEDEERGRLFVKVVGLKYLDLPLPKGEKSYFALTLDNGLHCVTTSWLELGKAAMIGQEFELVVQTELEFQLTLQLKVDEAKFRPQSAVLSSPARQKASTFSRVFASPRKRKELDNIKQQLASQYKAKDPNAEVWEKLRTLMAQDGSFARAYVSLSDHEEQAFGRPYTVDISCFNEWAVEDQPSSVKSKKSTSSIAMPRKPPYKIGKLELQLLFVPKPKGAKDEDMPKSMNACIREMREAENVAARSWEGFLSQQGGDCPYWRRRYFKLQGSKLTAFHETTRQPRATINLAKAVKLIDDKSSLTQKETTTRGGGRRKSAFAEEEEGYMFVEEGFRIRFGNGEVIDFYADSAAEKGGWMKVLGETVGKGTAAGSGPIKPWTELVLKHENGLKSMREVADRLLGTSTNNKTSTHPPPPAKIDVTQPPTTSTKQPPTPQSPRPRHKHTFSQPEIRAADERRQKTRSMIF